MKPLLLCAYTRQGLLVVLFAASLPSIACSVNLRGHNVVLYLSVMVHNVRIELLQKIQCIRRGCRSIY
jgi:hypothetical protein